VQRGEKTYDSVKRTLSLRVKFFKTVGKTTWSFRMKNKRILIIGVALVLFVLVSGTVFADEYVIDTHTYTRSDGVIRRDGVFSGAGPYKNESSAVHRENEGPIPHGTYTLEYIGETNLGPDTVHCIPSPNNDMYARKPNSFYIHGGTKSAGCIIINDPAFRRSLDGHTLTVR